MEERQTYRHTHRDHPKPVHFGEAMKCPPHSAPHLLLGLPTPVLAWPPPPPLQGASLSVLGSVSSVTHVFISICASESAFRSWFLTVSQWFCLCHSISISLYFVPCFSASHAWCHLLCIDLCLSFSLLVTDSFSSSLSLSSNLSL